MQIDVIVDDNGTGLFRASLARFVQRMEGRAVMALRSSSRSPSAARSTAR